jgi:hypothetical protein
MRAQRLAVVGLMAAAALAAPARAAVELATLDTPGSVRKVVLDGAIAYLADAAGGVRVVDVANPAAPVEIASLPPVQLGNVQSVYLDGDRLYSAESSGGVSVIDVANPAAPVRLGRVTGMSQVADVVASGDTAFAISSVGPGFHVIDASDPSAPVVVASLGATGTSIRWHSPNRLIAGTRLVDVSDPLNPSIVAENFVYPTAIGDGFGIATSLRRYDLADPESPVVVNQAIAPGGSFSAVALDAELAWGIGTSSGLGLHEVSDARPTYPLLGSIAFPSLHFVNQLRVVGTRLYLTVSGTGATGLYVYDVSDPAAPVQLGYFAAGDLGDVDVIGDVAYAVDRSFFDDGVAGLYAIDVSYPAAMELLALVPFEGGELVRARGDRVYVLDNDFTNASTLRIFDATDPASPTEVGTLAGLGVVDGMESSGNLLLLATSQWLRIYDVATPGAITLRGEYWSSGIKRGLAIEGTRAWVTSDQIEVLDFTLPFAPALVASFDLPSTEFRNPVRVGSRLHVHASRGQILTLDVSDLGELRVVGTSLLSNVGGLVSDASAATSGDAVFFARNSQITAYDTAGTSGLGARDVASFPSITGTTIVLDAARDLAFVTDGVLRVVDVAADRALAECANGRDDDGDGFVDHAEDPECRDGHDRSERADCGNGADDDGDGAIDLADAGCANGAEASEAPNCDDGVDDDGDGFADFGADPGCKGWSSDVESPHCQNGLDDDGDGKIDFDGGASVNGGVPIGAPDPNCGVASRPKETPGSCGLGAELALAALGFDLLWRRARVRPRVRRS